MELHSVSVKWSFTPLVAPHHSQSHLRRKMRCRETAAGEFLHLAARIQRLHINPVRQHIRLRNFPASSFPAGPKKTPYPRRSRWDDRPGIQCPHCDCPPPRSMSALVPTARSINSAMRRSQVFLTDADVEYVPLLLNLRHSSAAASFAWAIVTIQIHHSHDR